MPDVHPVFQSSGKKQGLEIWRIENFEPVPVPKNQYGNFYSGDSYIVLKTTGTTNLSWDIHFWLGSGTTQDEAAAAAMWTVRLDDDQFHGAAVQHRETQGYESKMFLGYFKSAIRYLDGGHASGFSHVTINAGAQKRLFHIKGKKNPRVVQVEASVSSMNKGDCFILDVDHDIYVYIGPKSNAHEKIDADMIAKQIRDQDHNGRGEITIVDSYSPESDFEKFFAALGSGSKDDVADAREGGDDDVFERGVEAATLSEISDKSGKMSNSMLPKPIKKEQLNSNECYILDTGSSGIYVWVGRHSNKKEKDTAFKWAEYYRKEHNYPPWVHVSKVPEGMEPAEFKQYFEDWD